MDTSRLLQRNILSTVSVWWMPTVVPLFWIVLLTSIWATACNTIVCKSDLWQSGDKYVQVWLVIAQVLQGLLAFGTLRFFMMSTSNVVDALYIAFALDKD